MGSLIGIFDSGIGGRSVLTSCKELLPNEKFLYYADTEYAPYGDKSDEYIAKRVFEISNMLIEKGAKAIVVACNTATNVGIKLLRQHFKIPFVGLEPAIKPAVKAIKEGRIILLCTPATARQEKFRELLAKHGTANIEVAPQKNLACLIESNFDNLEMIRDGVYKMLESYKDAEGIILGCTHYIFIKNIITDFYGSKKITIFDGNAGAAQRLQQLLREV